MSSGSSHNSLRRSTRISGIKRRYDSTSNTSSITQSSKLTEMRRKRYRTASNPQTIEIQNINKVSCLELDKKTMKIGIDINHNSNNNTCETFIDYISTGLHSLQNVLRLQNACAFNDITCCHRMKSKDKCTLVNDGYFFICLHCVCWTCIKHITHHSLNTKHCLFFDLNHQKVKQMN